MFILKSFLRFNYVLAQSAGAVEYTDGIFAAW